MSKPTKQSITAPGFYYNTFNHPENQNRCYRYVPVELVGTEKGILLDGKRSAGVSMFTRRCSRLEWNLMGGVDV